MNYCPWQKLFAGDKSIDLFYILYSIALTTHKFQQFPWKMLEQESTVVHKIINTINWNILWYSHIIISLKRDNHYSLQIKINKWKHPSPWNGFSNNFFGPRLFFITHFFNWEGFNICTLNLHSKGPSRKKNPPLSDIIFCPAISILIYFYIGFKGFPVHGKNWGGPLKSLRFTVLGYL